MLNILLPVLTTICGTFGVMAYDQNEVRFLRAAGIFGELFLTLTFFNTNVLYLST